MSREYARRSRGGGNLPLIIAIVGTIIVVAVVAYFFFGRGNDNSLSNETAEITQLATMAATSTPGPTPAPSVLVAVLPTPLETTPLPAEVTATPTPQKVHLSATVWASSLNVREGPSLSYSVIAKVKYGQTFKVFEETSKFVKIQLSSGAYGWIWRAWTVRGNDPVPAKPTSPPEPSLMSSASLSGSVIRVNFSVAVWGNSGKTEDIPITAFDVIEGAATDITITNITDCSGGKFVDLTITGTSGGTLKVKLLENKVFGSDGKASNGATITLGAGSDTTAPTVSFGGSGTTVTATFSETVFSTNSGSGTIAASAFAVSVLEGTVSHSVVHSDNTVTLTIVFSGEAQGTVINTAIVLYPSQAFDAAGNACTGGNYNYQYTMPS